MALKFIGLDAEVDGHGRCCRFLLVLNSFFFAFYSRRWFGSSLPATECRLLFFPFLTNTDIGVCERCARAVEKLIEDNFFFL